jgi:uncharacterized NAD(P)/FAD-binding protein YdhS
MRNIAIIGGGLSGTLAAINLLRYSKSVGAIFLIEKKKEQMAKGLAYSNTLKYQPLNVRASQMSLFSEFPVHFVKWLYQNRSKYAQEIGEFSADSFISRRVFGEYLKSTLYQTAKDAQELKKLHFINDEALAIEQTSPNKYTINFKETAALEVDKIVLALGNFPPPPLAIHNQGFLKSDLYVSNPWEFELDKIHPKEPVFIIGSGLTMIDIVGSLHAQNHQGKIYVLSRRGLVPLPHQLYEVPIYKLKALPSRAYLSLNDILTWFREEKHNASHLGYDWHSVVNAVRDKAPEIWQKLDLPEKQRFLRHLRPFWEVHRHRMPLKSAHLISKLQKEGQLEIIAGKLVDIQNDSNQAKVEFRRRKQPLNEEVYVDKVINCTGSETNLYKISSPLLKNLLDKGWLQTDDLYLGIQTDKYAHLINQKGEALGNIFVIGSLRKSGLWESTSLKEIRYQAELLPKHLDIHENLKMYMTDYQ